jgi:hypothetical protein
LRKAHGVVIGRSDEVIFQDADADSFLLVLVRQARDSHSELTAQLCKQHRTNGSTSRDAERWLAFTRNLSEHADLVLDDGCETEEHSLTPPQPEFADVMARTSELMARYESVLGPTLAVLVDDADASELADDADAETPGGRRYLNV